MKRLKAILSTAIMAVAAVPATIVAKPAAIPADTCEQACARQREDTQYIFAEYEEQARFNGNLFRWLASNLRYPEEAAKNDIEGRVIVQFYIEKDGSITNITVARGVDPLLDQEAVRLIEAMPRWIPGKSAGKPVRSYYTLPVMFKLQH